MIYHLIEGFKRSNSNKEVNRVKYFPILISKLKDTDIEKCISTPTMSCERLMPTECNFEDTKTTYISSWPKQKSARDCLHACEITTIPTCHFWMLNSTNEKCDLYERDKRTCHSVGGPASMTGFYCTGVT